MEKTDARGSKREEAKSCDALAAEDFGAAEFLPSRKPFTLEAWKRKRKAVAEDTVSLQVYSDPSHVSSRSSSLV